MILGQDRISPYSVQMRENADQHNSENWHFLRSADVAGVAKSLLIFRMLLLSEKLFWLFNALPLEELVWKLDSDCTCVSTFSCNTDSFEVNLCI